MTEFLVIAPVLIVLVMGAVQLVFVYQAKTTLNYATFEAARAASLENASMAAMQAGFARGMAAYFTRPGGEGADADPAELAAAVSAGQQLARDEIANGFVRFERINPTDEAFRDFGTDTTATGELEIPNDHLLFRSADTGSESGLSIQDSNLLKIRVTYCMRLIVPFINHFFVATARSLGAYNEDDAEWYTDRGTAIDSGWGVSEADCLSNHEQIPGDYRWPIVAHAVIRMQSPPRQCIGCFPPSASNN